MLTTRITLSVHFSNESLRISNCLSELHLKNISAQTLTRKCVLKTEITGVCILLITWKEAERLMNYEHLIAAKRAFQSKQNVVQSLLGEGIQKRG